MSSLTLCADGFSVISILKTAKAYLRPPPVSSKKKYQRKPGSRRYIDYTEAKLKQCLTAIRSKLLTQRKAAEHYNIPYSTIKYKLAYKSSNKPGRKPIFTDEEEQKFIKHMTVLTECGFPITNLDIKMIIRDYLVSKNRVISLFKNNMPGKDWLKTFLERHPCLLRCNINKIYRAHITDTDIIEFIENVALETENIPPENIYSYDEILLSDNSDTTPVVARRLTKYLEKSSDEMQPSFSVFFCGNAAGEALPPYIMFKSEYLDSKWTEKGPEDAGYNCSTSGCIDSRTFEDWFVSHLLPVLKKKKGRKVIFGDYRASHISRRVIRECESHRICLMCIPTGATQILQPLHMVYFLPLKLMWQELLLDWESTQDEPILAMTEKDYPYLLSEVLNASTETRRNLIDGFKMTGIYPANKSEPIARLLRYYSRGKKKKTGSFSEMSNNDLDYMEHGPSNLEHNDDLVSKNASQEDLQVCNSEISIGNTSDVHLLVVDGDDVLRITLQSDYQNNLHDINIGDYVMVTWDNCLYPANVVSTSAEGALVYCMKRVEKFWCWPEQVEAQFYSWEDIVCKIDAPTLEKKECFTIPEIDYEFNFSDNETKNEETFSGPETDSERESSQLTSDSD